LGEPQTPSIAAGVEEELVVPIPDFVILEGMFTPELSAAQQFDFPVLEFTTFIE